MRSALVALVLVGCTGEKVTLVTGTVFEGRDIQDPPLGGAEVVFVDYEGTRLGKTTASGDGTFAIEVPSETNVFLEVHADGFQPTSFAGVIGLAEELEVDVRLYPYDPAEIDALRTEFAGCPGADQPGGVVVGEVRLDSVVDPGSGEEVIVTTATATATTADGSEYEACYRDFDGIAYDAGALRTGQSGVFVIFGVPQERLDLDLSYEYVEGAFVQQFYPVWVPEDGAVSPWFPARVPFVY